MGDFYNYGAVAATAAGVNAIPNTQRNIAANKRVMIRAIRAEAADLQAIPTGGNAIFNIVATDPVTAAVIAQFQVILVVPALGNPVFSDGDRKIYFNSGANGAVITVTCTAVINQTISLSYSGKYN